MELIHARPVPFQNIHRYLHDNCTFICRGCPAKKFTYKSISFFPYPPNRLVFLFLSSIIEDRFKGFQLILFT